MRRLRIVILLLLFIWLFAQTGKFLVINHPEKSDTILILAGETDVRPSRGIELLNQGYGSRLVLDVPADARVYGLSLVDLAQKWIVTLPKASTVEVCPIHGLSTKAEALEATECLSKAGGQSILLVTSDYHTRRALSVFRHEIPGKTFRAAAAYDPTQFGPEWWKHRQWAKTASGEWVRFIWWEVVDRWR